ncbi:copper amine oxidase N-terminal domain-containing protein [Clostridiales bacterium BAD-6]|uniref:Copper amine oxidase N-terminal domain-containing protein n=2 Tax=Sinanaerobacter chloroacetimidivorans TaxID=2818044 RepID=A0A8J7W008_9FIRM|nr:copper amine oxidase N-terminal domain-containing protein [Sinanaerobacter chloroacetimidivorans]
MTDVIAQSSEIKVKYNGTYLTFDQPPVNQDGSVLVPMKVIFEAIGAALTWDPAEKKVTAILGDKTIVLVIGNQTATVNGVPQTLSVPAKLINSRTMVPVRFVSESLDADVSWDQTTKTVIIKN